MVSAHQLSQEEVQRMRAIVADHDRGAGVVNSFDINNPAKVRYVHQDFPCTVYHHESSEPSRTVVQKIHGEDQPVHIPAKLTNVIVNSQEELDAKLADGWSLKPPAFDSEEEATPRGKRKIFGGR